MKLVALTQLQPELVLQKAIEGGQPLQPIHHNHPTLVIFGKVEHWQRDPHDDRFNQPALLVIFPNEVPLKIWIHDVPFLLDPPNDFVHRPGLATDQESVDGVVAPRRGLLVQTVYLITGVSDIV